MAENKITPFPVNLIRGDTPLVEFPLTDKSKLPVDLTGWFCTLTITATEQPTNTDTPVIQVKVTGDTTGTPEFQLCNGVSLNDTSLLIPGTTYNWDLQLSNEGSSSALRIFTPLRGTVGVDTDYNVTTQ